ncbi:MAG: 16S rRNA (cytidine(1402)-2'-O)-methyltransferase [Simkaniaceae bacterium]
MLYLVASPIGNLADISYRAVQVLKLVDYILCEDTRQTAKLLEKYHVQKKLYAFHKFNEKSLENSIIKDLKDQKNIALLSDAGTPTISDPGTKLVHLCRQLQIPLTSLPGPSAVLTALSLSGLEYDRFQFLGFLPKKAKDLLRVLEEMDAYPGVSVFFESPHRLVATLQHFHQAFPSKILYIARELTKKFEEFLTGTAQDLLHYFAEYSPKGEFTVLVQGSEKTPNTAENIRQAEALFHLLTEKGGFSKRDAVQFVSQILGIPKNNLYFLAKE